MSIKTKKVAISDGNQKLFNKFHYAHTLAAKSLTKSNKKMKNLCKIIKVYYYLCIEYFKNSQNPILSAASKSVLICVGLNGI